MTPTKARTPWTSYLSVIIGLLLFGWGIAAAWFGLEKRVTLLERGERYIHGDMRPYLEDR